MRRRSNEVATALHDDLTEGIVADPGLFLVRPDGTLYWGSTQTMPFARPHFDEILGALDFVAKNERPAREKYSDAV